MSLFDRFSPVFTDELRGKPLYTLIRNAVRPDGSLPVDFALPQKAWRHKITFMDGALDGIMLYHSDSPRQDVRPLCAAFDQIAAGDFGGADRLLYSYFRKRENPRMLRVIDPLQEWIQRERGGVDAELLYRYALAVIERSVRTEEIKFALALLELLDTGDDAAVRQMVTTLALSDEFTLFALYSERRWPDGNAQVFETARRVHGWGRIHAVEQLEPDNGEIRSWLLHEGWDNRVMGEYSALTCARKGGLLERLEQPRISRADFTSAGQLLVLLTNAGPVSGLNDFERPSALLSAYLAHAAAMADTREDLMALDAVKAYVESSALPDKPALLAACRRAREK